MWIVIDSIHIASKWLNLTALIADHAMPEETTIVGDASGSFLFGSGDSSHSYSGDLYFFDAVALVFARDKEKSHGTSFC